MSEETEKAIKRQTDIGNNLMDLAKSYFCRAEGFKRKADNNFWVAEDTYRKANHHLELAKMLKEENDSN